jgi:hypothetical protein
MYCQQLVVSQLGTVVRVLHEVHLIRHNILYRKSVLKRRTCEVPWTRSTDPLVLAGWQDTLVHCSFFEENRNRQAAALVSRYRRKCLRQGECYT